MKHVPKYLLPRIAPVSMSGTESVDTGAEKGVGFVPFKKHHNVRGRTRGRGQGRGGGSNSRGSKKKSDPLKKFGR